MDMRGQSQHFPPKRGTFLASKLRILTEKGVFLGPNIREKGLFSKLENADMSSFIVLSEGAGVPTLNLACLFFISIPRELGLRFCI